MNFISTAVIFLRHLSCQMPNFPFHMVQEISFHFFRHGSIYKISSIIIIIIIIIIINIEANIWAQEGENGEWRRHHNEELHNLYRSPNIVREIKFRILRWAGHVARMEEGRSAFKILTGKTTGKRSLGRPRHRWEFTKKR